VAKLPGKMGTAFGEYLAIDGDTLVVGAHKDSNDNGYQAGAVFVHYRNQGGADNWGEVAKLTASDGRGNDTFGLNVSVSGEVIAVGAFWRGYIFQRDRGGLDNWGEVTRLSVPGAESVFGSPVAVSGDTVVVGDTGLKWKNCEFSCSRGSVHVFSRNTGGTDNWGHVAQLKGEAYDGLCGMHNAIHDDTVVMGCWAADTLLNVANGVAHVYRKDRDGAWKEAAMLYNPKGARRPFPGNSLSSPLAFDGSTIVLGSESHPVGGQNVGATFIFSAEETP
jgi:hypothetical protein